MNWSQGTIDCPVLCLDLPNLIFLSGHIKKLANKNRTQMIDDLQDGKSNEIYKSIFLWMYIFVQRIYYS